MRIGYVPILILVVMVAMMMGVYAETSGELFNRGAILFNQEKYADSVAVLDQAIQLDPNNAAIWTHKSFALRKLGRNDEALQAFSKAQELGYTGSYDYWGENKQVSEPTMSLPAAVYEQPTVVEQPKTVEQPTMGEQNAAKKAKTHLKYLAYSRDGLIKQLEFEQFSHEEAEYGTDNSGADWNEQAAKKAKTYLKYSAYSRDGLIEQLEFEGFTRQQAEYGVEAIGY